MHVRPSYVSRRGHLVLLKPILNRSERRAYQHLYTICASRSAKVYTKVRVADVLPIESSGLSGELFEFALQAHYDFVVTRADDHPLFAVELDGPTHDSSVQAERDAKKDELSSRFGLTLHRVRTRLIWDSPDGLEEISESIRRWLDESELGETFGDKSRSAPSVRRRESGQGEKIRPVCPECGSGMVEKMGKRGLFLSCTRFPACRGALDLPAVNGAGTPPVIINRSDAPAREGETVIPGLPGRGAGERRFIAASSVDRDAVAAILERCRIVGSDLLSSARAIPRSVVAGYRALPDWLQAILWGLGISLTLLGGVLVIWRAAVQ
jgi:hypothetical protein